jgi:hypothetical protein
VLGSVGSSDKSARLGIRFVSWILVLSSLDMADAFLSVPLDEQISEYTSFLTRKGQFKYVCLPAGLGSAIAVFNQLTAALFWGLLWSHVMVFVDDVISPCRTVEDGLKTLRTVFERIRDGVC